MTRGGVADTTVGHKVRQPKRVAKRKETDS